MFHHVSNRREQFAHAYGDYMSLSPILRLCMGFQFCAQYVVSVRAHHCQVADLNLFIGFPRGNDTLKSLAYAEAGQ